MKEIIIMDSETHITVSDIKSVEEALKVKLPPEYKHFLLKHNGGHPVKDMYPIIEIYDFHRYGWGTSSVHDCGISWFYAVYDGEYNNFVKENLYKERPAQDGFIIIGCSSGGDEICMGIKEDNFGKIFYWGHDWEQNETSLTYVLVANSFIDFINSLYKVGIEGDVNEEGVFVTAKDVYTHDKYSLPFSTEVKTYGNLVTDFFAQAPTNTQDFVIEEYPESKDLILYYDDKEKNIRHKRIIKPDSSYTDSEKKIEPTT